MRWRKTLVTVSATLFVISWTWSRSTATSFQAPVIPRSQLCSLKGGQLLTTSSTAPGGTSPLIKEVWGRGREIGRQVPLLLLKHLRAFFFPGTRGLTLTGSLSLLSEEALWSVNGLPNVTMPSDHLSLLAKFQMDLKITWVEELSESKGQRQCFCCVLFS